MNRRLILFAALAVVVSVFVIFSFCTKVVKISVPETKKRAFRPAEERLAELPPDEYAPLVALVLDDFGYTKKNLNVVEGIDAPLTIAVLPNTPYSKAVCSFADENGLEVILHLPMEPENETDHLEKDTIGSEMDDATVKKIIADAFRSVPSAKGASNHMGSKATKDSRLMTVVFDDLKKRDMFFLDSFTSGDSACERVAQKVGIPYVRRDIFIDNELEEGYIRQQTQRLEQIAFANGSAVGIGHDRSVTVDVLQRVVRQMEEKGVRFVFLSEIAKKKETEAEEREHGYARD
jgi:polysaccharide deacetylase 2 family uncharacterized protein YibQ